MIIQPDYKQIDVLIDDLINFKIASYHKLRNFVYYDKDRFKNVSALSAFISRGILREKTLLRKVLSSENKNEKFVQEIFWRVYWQGWLESHTGIWKDYKKSIKYIENNKLNNFLNYQDAVNAKTPIKPFNEWVKILKKYGYLHNHERMWFASIWIHYLQIPWELGQKFFYENLIDGDVASNLLSWRWVAGLQTFGKKYIATEENINKYTNNRYLGFKLPEIKNISLKIEDKILNNIIGASIQNTYKNSCFLIMENNLNIDLFNKVKNDIDVLVLIKFKLKDIEKSKNVLEFQNSLCNAFLKNKFLNNKKKEKIEFYEFELPKDSNKVISLLKTKGIKNILYDYIRVGYEKDIFDTFLADLKKDTLIHNILDDFYNEAWQHCRKGFFKFKDQIPKLSKKFC
ncbi:DNA photolyase [Alphaproteobacteria bacterium]|nr:DNA photolyase [Alphaproteobacteria bacterium]